MSEIEVLRMSLEAIAGLDSPSPPRLALRIGMRHEWKNGFWDPYMHACQAIATRAAGKDTDPFYRYHSYYMRGTHLAFLSLILDKEILTSNQLTDAQAERVLHWLVGHHPDHMQYDEQARRSALEQRKQEVFWWLEESKPQWKAKAAEEV